MLNKTMKIFNFIKIRLNTILVPIFFLLFIVKMEDNKKMEKLILNSMR